MKLLEIKRLVEFDAVGTFMAAKHDNGWMLCVLKKDSSDQKEKLSVVLETARGGTRVFKTLDAMKKLMDSDLSNHHLLVV